MPPSKNKKRPTLNDIAQRCNVNKGTVSRVLNGKFNNFSVTPDKFQEIKKTAEALGYKPNRMARVIRCNRTYLIGVSFLRFKFQETSYDTDNQIHELASFIRIMETHPLFDKYDFVLHSRHEEKGKPLSELDFKSDLLEGMIYLLPTAEHKEFLDVASPKFPVVLVGNIPGAAKKVPCIDINNRKAVKNAMTYLIEKGRKNIIMLIPENLRNIQCIKDRIRGYKDALTAFKIPLNRQQIHFVPSGADNVLDLLKKLKSLPKINAAFCVSDLMASDCIIALKRLNYKVPEDIAVIGFDDSMICPLTSPTLSSIKRPVQEQAYQAIDTLLKILEKKKEYTPGFIEIETQLIKRESTEGTNTTS